MFPMYGHTVKLASPRECWSTGTCLIYSLFIRALQSGASHWYNIQEDIPLLPKCEILGSAYLQMPRGHHLKLWPFCSPKMGLREFLYHGAYSSLKRSVQVEKYCNIFFKGRGCSGNTLLTWGNGWYGKMIGTSTVRRVPRSLGLITEMLSSPRQGMEHWS